MHANRIAEYDLEATTRGPELNGEIPQRLKHLILSIPLQQALYSISPKSYNIGQDCIYGGSV